MVPVAMLTAASSVLSGMGGGGSSPASQPDTVTIDTGDITPTVGGGSMNVGASEWSWLTPVILVVVALIIVRKLL